MNRVIFLVISLILLVLISCTKTPIEQYNSLVKDFKEGSLKQTYRLKESFLKINSSLVISSKKITHNHNAVIKRSDKKLTMIFPDSYVIKDHEIKNLKFYDGNNLFSVYSNGYTVHIYNKKGHLKNLNLGSKKNPIKALILYKDNIIYYKNFRIYIMNIASEDESLLIKRKFMPYYSKYFNVNLKSYNNHAVLTYGVAGKYSLYIINIQRKKFISSKLPSASTRTSISQKGVYYVDGRSGRWRILYYNIQKKKKRVIKRFKKIYDIELSSDIYVLDNDKNVSFYDYENKKHIFFKGFSYHGFCKNSIMIKYRSKIYIVPAKKYLSAYKKLINEIPAIISMKD